jgi:hypothetical protein
MTNSTTATRIPPFASIETAWQDVLGILAQHLLDGPDPSRQTEAIEGTVHIL